MPSTRSKTRPKPNAAAGSWQFSAIGTEWWIDIREPLTDTDLQSLRQLVGERIEHFDVTYSRFRPDSLVTRMSKQAGVYQLPPDSKELFRLYQELYDATNGAITPLIGDLLVAAGYDATYSLRPKQPQKPLSWDRVLSYTDGALTIKQPVMLDFGAAGKGYLVDLVAGVIRTQDVTSFCIDAGGDMVVYGMEELRVGLEHPDDPGQVIGVATLANRALAGSAGNRRAWAGYHHIMNPFTLASPMEPKAVWVVADSALLADGLTTALYFVSPEQLNQFDFEYLIVNSKNQYKRSPNFPAEVF